MIYDFAIIGAGIVGLAAAREILHARPGSSIIVLEKESTVAQHQTGHNSGVIHAGIYYAPGSLKARFCREGAAATKAFCVEQGIKFETCGKLLVATNESERLRMDALFERANQNGVEAEQIHAAELSRLEPNITGVGALLIPSTAIVDYKTVASAFAQTVAAQGAELQLCAGIRAQAVMRDGTMMHDFLFEETARMLHVCNAPSPAATSAIPIGRMVAAKALRQFRQR